MSLKTALLSSKADARVLRTCATLLARRHNQFAFMPFRLALARGALAEGASASTGAETSPDAPGPAGAADSRDTAE
ncbi:MAG: hypothetical protein ACRDBL_09510 [Rhabdaerophilum sp.]